jgi:hypothetical protein
MRKGMIRRATLLRDLDAAWRQIGDPMSQAPFAAE